MNGELTLKIKLNFDIMNEHNINELSKKYGFKYDILDGNIAVIKYNQVSRTLKISRNNLIISYNNNIIDIIPLY